ncbi:MAG: MFS transporter [Chloroflexi bacterium]|nr:MFS transporter [Chloroflexota bacterium]
MLRKRPLPPYPVYLVLQAVSSGFYLLVTTVAAMYGVEQAHLGALQLLLVGTTLEATCLVFQAPTGALADAVSRRLSVLVGLVLSGLGFILWGTFARFDTILLAQVLWGLGYTFVDGAQQAWIADELGDGAAGRAFIRGTRAGQIGAVAGIVCSTALATISLPLPMIVAGVGYILLAAVLVAFMPERPRPHRDVRLVEAAGRMSGTVRAGFRVARGSALLLSIIGISAIFGAASVGTDRLRDIHVLQDMTLPRLWGMNLIVWFGVVQVDGLGLSAVASEVAMRRLDTGSHRQIAAALTAINGGIVVTVVLFGLVTRFSLALPLIWAYFVLRRTYAPLTAAWLHQSLDPSVRATIFSLQSLADSFGRPVAGVPLGVLATAVTIRAGIVASGLLFAPALVLYARALRGGAAAGPEPSAVEERR